MKNYIILFVSVFILSIILSIPLKLAQKHMITFKYYPHSNTPYVKLPLHSEKYYVLQGDDSDDVKFIDTWVSLYRIFSTGTFNRVGVILDDNGNEVTIYKYFSFNIGTGYFAIDDKMFEYITNKYSKTSVGRRF